MRFWNLTPEPDTENDAELDIDGEIVAERGWLTPDGACVAKDFRKALAGVGNVTVHINSPGGDVMAGAEIYSALREHSLSGRGSVHVIVTALAASAASIIAMAGDRISMHPVAYMMIHNPWTLALGDARELRKTAKTLDVIAEGLIGAYQARTGKSRDELKRLLDNETWMSAQTCVAEGFADEVYGADAAAAASLARPTMMSAKSHGVAEIAARILAAEPDRDPDEEPDTEETEPDGRNPGGEPDGKPEEEPDEKPEEEPDEDPDEEPDEDPDEDPDEEPDEDPEKAKKDQAKTRREIADRARIAARAAAAAGWI